MSLTFNMTGGGAGSNFNIRTYPVGTDLSLVVGQENEIAVLTDATMTDWQISYTRPASPAEGLVWIMLVDTGNCMFNVFKRHNMTVGLAAAYQYISGAWASVDAKIYQNNAWHDFRTYLFREGMGQLIQWRGNSAVFTDNDITVGASGSKVGIATYYKYDFSEYSKLFVDLTPNLSTSNGYLLAVVFSSKNTGDWSDYYSSTQGYNPSGATQTTQFPPNVAPIINGVRSTISVSIASAVKEAPLYLAMCHYYSRSGSYAFKVHNIWLE